MKWCNPTKSYSMVEIIVFNKGYSFTFRKLYDYLTKGSLTSVVDNAKNTIAKIRNTKKAKWDWRMNKDQIQMLNHPFVSACDLCKIKYDFVRGYRDE